MLSRHPRDLDARDPVLSALRHNIDHHAVEEVQIVHILEILLLALGRETALGMRCRDDRQRPPQTRLDLLVKVIPMVVAQQHDINPR